MRLLKRPNCPLLPLSKLDNNSGAGTLGVNIKPLTRTAGSLSNCRARQALRGIFTTLVASTPPSTIERT